MFSMLRYVYDIFGWTYRRVLICSDKSVVDIFYYDLGEDIVNKHGEFLKPISQSIIKNKNVLESAYEIDNAIALSPYPLIDSNTDKSGTTNIQQITTNKPLQEIAPNNEIEDVEKFEETGIGALPYLNILNI